MAQNTLHGEQAIPFSEKVELTWGQESIERADRGPAIQTSIAVESDTGEPIARMNLYGPMVLLSGSSDKKLSLRAYSPNEHFYSGVDERTISDVLRQLPTWVMDTVYVGDVIVLNQEDRGKGIGKNLVSQALHNYKESSRLNILQKAVGISSNPAMLRAIENLGGRISQNYKVLGLNNPNLSLEEMGYQQRFDLGEPQLQFGKRLSPRKSELMVVDMGIAGDRGFELGFSALYDNSDAMAGVRAIAVPERRIEQIDHPEISKALLGQMLVMLSPDLSDEAVAKYERDLAELVISHRWNTILQRSGEVSDSYHGEYLVTKKEMSVFELQIT